MFLKLFVKNIRYRAFVIENFKTFRNDDISRIKDSFDLQKLHKESNFIVPFCY